MSQEDDRKAVIESHASTVAARAKANGDATYTITDKDRYALVRQIEICFMTSDAALTADELDHFERCVRIEVEREAGRIHWQGVKAAIDNWTMRVHGRDAKRESSGGS